MPPWGGRGADDCSGNWGLTRGTKLKRLSQSRLQTGSSSRVLPRAHCLPRMQAVSETRDRESMGAGLVRSTRMQLSVPTAAELGSSPRISHSHYPTLSITVWSEQWEPPGLGPGTGRFQEAQASSPASYPLCCSAAQRLGPEVIMKMENVVWPHNGASLTCLFVASTLCTPPHPLPLLPGG